MISSIRKNRLQKLWRERDDPKTHALAMKRIERVSLREESKNSDMASGDGASLADMKVLLKEWFDNEDMVPIGKFLRKQNKAHLKDDMHSFIHQNRLKKLRRERDDPKTHALAMKRIEAISFRDDREDASITPGGLASLAKAKKNERKGATGSASGAVKVCGLMVEAADQDFVRRHLKGWFCDYSRSSVSDYLEAKGRLDLLPVMKRLVRKLELDQLRREHHLLCKKANKGIDGVFKMNKGTKKNNEVGEDKMPIPSAPPLDEGDLSDDLVDVVAADISRKMDIAAPMDTDDDDESEYVSIADSTVVAKNFVDGK